ncbi:acyltransferase [Arthrobacter sp. ISL-69]|nr:acyltransferase [Arthrobacter sp. ISL-69]
MVIGANCLLGPNVTVLSENHEFSNTTVPIKSQGNIRNAVRIGDDCWVGAGAKILAGVTIGHGSIIAAGAVVTKSFEPYSVVGGVPAKIIRLRENLTSQLDHGSDV